MVLPPSTSAFSGQSPSPTSTRANAPRLATHLNEQVYIEARDLLSDVFEKSRFGKFPTLLRYLPRLSFAQLEAIDKARCNLFRGQEVSLKARIKELKKYTEQLNQTPWFRKYRWSGALVGGGAALRALTFLYQGNSFVAIARVISQVSLYAGALLGAAIKVRDIYYGVTYQFAKLELPTAKLANVKLRIGITVNQKKKLGTTHIRVRKKLSPSQSIQEETRGVAVPSNITINNGPTEIAREVGADGTGHCPEPSSSGQPSSSNSAVSQPANSARQEPEEARVVPNATERALIAERELELAKSKLEQVLAQLRLLGTDVRIHEEETT